MQEQSAKSTYLKIVDEFEKTGYKVSDIFINIGDWFYVFILLCYEKHINEYTVTEFEKIQL